MCTIRARITVPVVVPTATPDPDARTPALTPPDPSRRPHTPSVDWKLSGGVTWTNGGSIATGSLHPGECYQPGTRAPIWALSFWLSICRTAPTTQAMVTATTGASRTGREPFSRLPIRMRGGVVS
jgi:hypothetical protein